ncbi:MAG: carboxypeptidase regulatory-like domain-containing protein [Phycisphaerae bacterium]
MRRGWCWIGGLVGGMVSAALGGVPAATPCAPASTALASAVMAQSRRRVFATYRPGTVEKGGKITGVVTYTGKVPDPRKIAIVKDPETCGKHPPTVPQLRVDDKGHVADAVVFLGNIAAGKMWSAKETDLHVVNQTTCEFDPHVQVIPIKLPFDIANNDPVAHNIKADQGVQTLFNHLQPRRGMRTEEKFEQPGLVELRCNVHDWMRAYVYVVPHPYYAVTGADGTFTLENVPPGKYDLVVWQEFLGEQTFAVELTPEGTATVEAALRARNAG